MPLSKRGRRKAKKAKAIELTLTDPSIARSYERKVERLLGKVHEEPLISYSWSVTAKTDDKEDAKEDREEYLSDSGDLGLFAKQAPEEPITESFIAVLIRFITVLLRFIIFKITTPTIEEPNIEETKGMEGMEGMATEKPVGMVLVRFIMTGFPKGVDPPKKFIELGFDTAQEMMEQACSDFALDYEKSSMLGPKVVMLPFQAKHEDHILELTAKYLKTISTYDDIMVDAFKKGETETTHVLGIEVLIVNTKNKIAMQFYDNVKMMARVIGYNDDSIERTKTEKPDVWANIPVIPFLNLSEDGAVNRPIHINI